jgi:hypothetical protein
MFQISQMHCLEFTNGTYLILTTVPPQKFHKTVYALHFILHFIVAPTLRRDPPATGDGRYGPGTLYGLWPRSRWTWTRRTVSG